MIRSVVSPHGEMLGPCLGECLKVGLESCQQIVCNSRLYKNSCDGRTENIWRYSKIFHNLTHENILRIILGDRVSDFNASNVAACRIPEMVDILDVIADLGIKKSPTVRMKIRQEFVENEEK